MDEQALIKKRWYAEQARRTRGYRRTMSETEFQALSARFVAIRQAEREADERAYEERFPA